ncbi:unnamed protein product [Gadus morhua 'NCC']
MELGRVAAGISGMAREAELAVGARGSGGDPEWVAAVGTAGWGPLPPPRPAGPRHLPDPRYYGPGTTAAGRGPAGGPPLPLAAPLPGGQPNRQVVRPVPNFPCFSPVVGAVMPSSLSLFPLQQMCTSFWVLDQADHHRDALQKHTLQEDTFCFSDSKRSGPLLRLIPITIEELEQATNGGETGHQRRRNRPPTEEKQATRGGETGVQRRRNRRPQEEKQATRGGETGHQRWRNRRPEEEKQATTGGETGHQRRRNRPTEEEKQAYRGGETGHHQRRNRPPEVEKQASRGGETGDHRRRNRPPEEEKKATRGGETGLQRRGNRRPEEEKQATTGGETGS